MNHTTPLAHSLILMRHAHALAATGKVTDFLRILEEEGEVKARSMAQQLAHHQLLPQVALVGPSTRTMQTWKILQETWKSMSLPAAIQVQTQLHVQEEIYLADVEQLLQELSAVDAAITQLLLVGHNPGLEQLVLQLTQVHQGLRPASIVVLRPDYPLGGKKAPDRGEQKQKGSAITAGNATTVAQNWQFFLDRFRWKIVQFFP